MPSVPCAPFRGKTATAIRAGPGYEPFPPPLRLVPSPAVLDKDAASSQRALAEIAKPATRENLVRYARWRCEDYDEAQDLLAEAFELVLDPDRKPWDDPGVSFRRHMRRVMDDIAIDKARSAKERREINERDLIAETGDEDAFPDPPGTGPLPDEAVHDKRKGEWLKGLWGRLEGLFRGKDPQSIAVYEAACRGHETAAEQAEYLGVPVTEVYETHRRMKHRALLLKAEWQKQETQRMFEARRRAKKNERVS